MARRRKYKQKRPPRHGSFVIQMQTVLGDYPEEVKAATYEAMDKVSEEAVQRLKATSPRGSKTRHPGRYAEGWTYEKRLDYNVIYNSTDYQLTHLLEYGHAVEPKPTHPGKKSRVEGISHIKPVEEWANAEFLKETERILSS